jgi:xylulokinase
MQIIADVTGEDINTMKVTMGACYGDALMAGITTGVYGGFEDLRSVIRPEKTYRPDPAAHEAYAPFRRLFEEAYEANRELMHRL